MEFESLLRFINQRYRTTTPTLGVADWNQLAFEKQKGDTYERILDVI